MRPPTDQLRWICLTGMLCVRAGWVAQPIQGSDSADTPFRVGQKLAEQGDYSRAEDALVKVAQAAEASGPGTVDFIVALNELGLVYHAQGKYSVAKQTYLRAIRLVDQYPQKLNLIRSRLLDNLAGVYVHLKRYGDAESLRQNALRYGIEALGPEHPQTSLLFSNLGVVYLARGKDEAAGQMFERALEILDRANGPDHGDAGAVLHNLGVLKAKAGRYTEADAYLGRAVRTFERALGPSHPQLVQALINHALTQFVVSPALVEQTLRRALAIAESAHGAGHPLVARVLFTYAEFLRKSKRKAEAAAMERRARFLQENHPDRALSRATVHISDLVKQP
jgi:tetratricopeptide (TPR) repeat protein